MTKTDPGQTDGPEEEPQRYSMTSTESGTAPLGAGRRCPWAEHAGPAELAYHDLEWGVPHHGDRALFELLSLEGAQAGLSWSIVLGRREGYRRAFAGFDPDLLATWTDEQIDGLLRDAAIIRHRGKIASVVSNARALCDLRQEGRDFDGYVWSFTEGVALQPRHASPSDVPTTTDVAAALGRDLKQRGFRFVGPTIAYAFMQAVGMTNDHLTSCFRWAELAG
jgi:DNA-3-methyladenine glycosylase I